MNKNITNTKRKIDWMITHVPLGIVIALCILFFLLPDQSNAVLSLIRQEEKQDAQVNQDSKGNQFNQPVDLFFFICFIFIHPSFTPFFFF